MKAVNPLLNQLFPSQPSKGDLKRLEIIEAAVTCISRDGFEGGTFEKIAQKMGTRRSHIVYYFKERNQLLQSVIQYVIANAQQITIAQVSAHSDPVDQLVAICDAAFEWAEKFPDQARLLTFFYYECSVNKNFRALQTQIREAGSARIRVLVGAAIGVNKKIDTVSLDEFAKGLQSVMTGLVLDFVTTDPAATKTYREMSGRLVRQWIRASARKK